MLIGANKALSRKQQVTPRTYTLKVSNHLSFANTLRGRVGKSKSSVLKGWRCRNCGSWDVSGAVIKEDSGSDQAVPSCRKAQLWEQSRGLAAHKRWG